MTRLALVVPFRDEADIIGDMIRFHLDKGVDFVVALDNGSVDGSGDIAAAVDRARVTVLHDGDHWHQHRQHGDLLVREAARLGADWVLATDADEFWWPASGDYRTEMREGGPGILRTHWLNFLPTPYPWKVSTLVGDFPGRQYENWVPKVCFRTQGFQSIGQGFHNVAVSGHWEVPSSNLVVYHYPVRSPEQFERKVRNCGSAYAQNPEAQSNDNMGKHVRDWYRALQAGALAAEYQKLVGAPGAQDGTMRDYWFSKAVGGSP